MELIIEIWQFENRILQYSWLPNGTYHKNLAIWKKKILQNLVNLVFSMKNPLCKLKSYFSGLIKLMMMFVFCLKIIHSHEKKTSTIHLISKLEQSIRTHLLPLATPDVRRQDPIIIYQCFPINREMDFHQVSCSLEDPFFRVLSNLEQVAHTILPFNRHLELQCGHSANRTKQPTTLLLQYKAWPSSPYTQE